MCIIIKNTCVFISMFGIPLVKLRTLVKELLKSVCK